MTGPHDASHVTASWPPFLTTRRTVAYTGLSRATLNRAVAAGALPVYGRPGGGERIFRRADIDRWLASGFDKRPASVPTPARRRPLATADADAIERIERAARGVGP
jgi:excisionase family DNA binding protein